MKKLTLAMLMIFALASCNYKNTKPEIQPKAFHKLVDGKQVDLFVLKNKNGMEMALTNYGGRIVSLMVPDKTGKMEDIVLGYDNIDSYLEGNEQYFGAAIGRYGNRIAKGLFALDTVQYKLATNNGPNFLHGGAKGFSSKVWKAVQKGGNEVELSLVSPDMEEGFPGELLVIINYRLTDNNELLISYIAKTNKPTVINLTNHSYFNLNGAGNGDILNQVLYINANNYTPIDSTFITTGKIESVTGTPFDFTTPVAIGDRINDNNEQLSFGLGYDHNFVLNKPEAKMVSFAASVYEPNSGRLMEVFTDEPGLQFYSGNFLKGKEKGKQNKPYNYRSGFCLESQHFPDSPNHPEFPAAVLKPENTYTSACIYKFSVK